ncbi:MAG: hypothetical protein WDA16_14745, partial [Candidatus Thermoplasmatota archaeon]
SSLVEADDIVRGASRTEAKLTSSKPTYQHSVSHFASWWSLEDRLDHVASFAALALGLAALLIVLTTL